MTNKGKVKKVATASKSVSHQKLDKIVSTAVTQQMKDVVKEMAGKLNSTVSAFTRKSLNDEVYHDLHPEASLPELVEAGHEEKSVIHKLPSTSPKRQNPQKEDTIITDYNTVSVIDLIKYLDLVKFLNIVDDKIDIIFTKYKAQLINPLKIRYKHIWTYIEVPQWHGDIGFETSFNDFYKLLTSTKTTNLNEEKATFIKQIDNGIVVKFSSGQLVHINAGIQLFSETNNEISFLIVRNDHLDNSEKVAQIKSTDLNRILKSVEYAHADVVLLPLHTVYFDFRDDKLMLGALNGLRLAYLEYPVKYEKSCQLLITAEVIDILMNILDSLKDEKPVDIFISKNGSKEYVEFHVDNYKLIAEFYTAEKFSNYMQWLKVNPENFRYIVEVDGNELYDSIKSFAAFYKNRFTQRVIFTLYKGKNDMKISASDEDIGESELTIPIKVMKNTFDDDMKIAFDPEFIMQPLKLWSTFGYDKDPDNKVILEITDSNNPILIHPKGSTKTYAVIKPIGLPEEKK